MPELVSKDEAHGHLALLRRQRENVRVEDHEVASEESRRECVEDSSRLKNEDRGRLVQSESAGMLVSHRIQFGELPTRDAHSVAAHVTDVEAVSNEERDDADYEICNQRAGNLSAAENGQCQTDIDHEANDNADGVIDLLLRMYQGLEVQRAGRARFRWHGQFLVVGR